MKSEMERVLENPEHVIISESLQGVLAEHDETSQSLFLDGSEYVCTLKSATLLNSITRMWRFVLEVPGIKFSDFANIPEIQFAHGNLRFGEFQALEIDVSNLDSQIVALSLKQIIKLEEASNE